MLARTNITSVIGSSPNIPRRVTCADFTNRRICSLIKNLASRHSNSVDVDARTVACLASSRKLKTERDFSSHLLYIQFHTADEPFETANLSHAVQKRCGPPLFITTSCGVLGFWSEWRGFRTTDVKVITNKTLPAHWRKNVLYNKLCILGWNSRDS